MSKKLKKWRASATIVGGKYLGEVEATTKAEAIQKAWELDSVGITFCFRCAGQCENAEVSEIHVEPAIPHKYTLGQ